MWLIFAIFSAFFAALVAIFGKVGIKNIDTSLATALRALIMFVFLAAVVIFQRKVNLSSIDNKALLFIIMSGIAGALSWLFYFSAIKLGPVSKIIPIDRLSVAFAIILAILFLGEKLTFKLAIGSVIMIIGALLII